MSPPDAENATRRWKQAQGANMPLQWQHAAGPTMRPGAQARPQAEWARGPVPGSLEVWVARDRGLAQAALSRAP